MEERRFKIPTRQDWIFGNDSLSFKKEDLLSQYKFLMFNRTLQMFEYKNLPSTITKKDLEYIVQVNGFGVFTKVNGEYYIFNSTLGGVPNEYYLPTIAVVTNPYLKFNKELEIDNECVVIKNDSLYQGLLPLANKYAYLLSETDISIKFACINSRILSFIGADNDSTRKDAEEVLKKIYNGEELGIIGTKVGLENIKMYPYNGNTNNYVNELLELHQYLKANWYIDLGINANYNMKRESLSQNETAVNEDTLLPLIDDMLECRKLALKKINEMYGLNIEVDLNSSWKTIKEKTKLEIELLENEIINPEEENSKEPINKEEKENEDL